MTRRVSAALVGLALAAALVPLPRVFIERAYSTGVYPPWQRLMTRGSNLVPFALFDLLCVAATAATAIALYRSVHARGWRWGLAAVLTRGVVAAAIVYLLFLMMWGLNYRRVWLADRLVFDSSRVTAESADVLTAQAVSELNATYAAAHRGMPADETLIAAFNDVHRALGGRLEIVPGRPKQTLFGAYFHQTAITGMTDPFFLETLMAPDLMPEERPFVLTHEWAHLAGYADESEANFVAWLTCVRAGDATRYSGWLGVVEYLHPTRRLPVRLAAGPRIDLQTIALRYSGTSRVLQAAARQSYDTYLRANRVRAGVVSYDLVIQLMLGTEFGDHWTPRLRSGSPAPAHGLH